MQVAFTLYVYQDDIFDLRSNIIESNYMVMDLTKGWSRCHADTLLKLLG